MKPIFRILWIVPLVLVLVGAAPAGAWGSISAPAVQAQEPETPEGGAATMNNDPQTEINAPVPGGPGYQTVSSFQFRPYSQSSSWAYSAATLYNPGSSLIFFEAWLPIPHGATITQFVVYFVDNSTSNLMTNLLRCPVESIGCTIMATINTSGMEATARNAATSSIGTPVVDLQNHSYIVEVGIPGNAGVNLGLIAARVDYAFTSSLPLVSRDP